ncbi:MAG: GPR endopeptidase [Clostridia bacterium]
MNKSYTQNYIPYYDLAAEAGAALRGETNREIPGVSEETEENECCRLSLIRILNGEGASIMKRPIGLYATIDTKGDLSEEETETHVVGVLSRILKDMIPSEGGDPVLICGIGNPEIASDSLGKTVIEHMLPTRHLFRADMLRHTEGFVPTALLIPNVLGNTGIEAAELTRAVTKEIRPKAVIIIDALATASSRRLGASFQITDTGLSPGGGIGNERPAINSDTLGVPVIAIGVPTVIYPQAIIMEAFAAMKQSLFQNKDSAAFQNWNTAEETLFQNTREQMLNFAVTPKDIDCSVGRLSEIISGGIQTALHTEVTPENYRAYFPQ